MMSPEHQEFLRKVSSAVGVDLVTGIMNVEYNRDHTKITFKSQAAISVERTQKLAEAFGIKHIEAPTIICEIQVTGFAQ